MRKCGLVRTVLSCPPLMRWGEDWEGRGPVGECLHSPGCQLCTPPPTPSGLLSDCPPQPRPPASGLPKGLRVASAWPWRSQWSRSTWPLAASSKSSKYRGAPTTPGVASRRPPGPGEALVRQPWRLPRPAPPPPLGALRAWAPFLTAAPGWRWHVPRGKLRLGLPKGQQLVSSDLRFGPFCGPQTQAAGGSTPAAALG